MAAHTGLSLDRLASKNKVYRSKKRKHQFEKKAKLLKQYAKTLESEEGQHKASVGPAKLYEQVFKDNRNLHRVSTRRKRKQVTAGSDDETSAAAEVAEVVEEAEEAAGGEVMVPEAGAWLRKSGKPTRPAAAGRRKKRQSTAAATSDAGARGGAAGGRQRTHSSKSAKPDPMRKAKLKNEARLAHKQALDEAEERKAAKLRQSQKKRRKQFFRMTKRTSKGQPVTKYAIKSMLAKLQSESTG